MSANPNTYQTLLTELEKLRERYIKQVSATADLAIQLEEANDTLAAIRNGEIDALVVNSNDGHKIYTLKSADLTYRIFIEQMIQGAVTINQTGVILYCNSQFASLVGLPLEKVIGQFFSAFITERDAATCGAMLAHAWANHDTQAELRLKGNDAEIPVLLSLKTLELDEGMSLSIIVTDLSDQKINEQLLINTNKELLLAEQLANELNANLELAVKERTKELYQSEQQLSRILETMAEGVVIVDVHNKMTYANNMAQKILMLNGVDYEMAEFHNFNWQSFTVSGEPLPKEQNPIALAMKTGQPIHDFEIAIKSADRETLYLSINAVPIYDEQQQLTGGMGTFFDVTHRRRATQQKDDFISVASHELKTPITGLKAALQLLLRIKDKPTDALPKLIEQANRSMNKVSGLIEELLNASKITSGQMHIHLRPFPLNALVEESLLSLNENDRTKIKVQYTANLSVVGDPDRIEQVLINFVNNALKYAANSSEISISLEKKDAFTIVSVKDQGPGIHPDKLPHLFDRYYRIDEGGIQYSGLGLGLYICAEIIKRHHGEIGVESKLGEGSVFWFSIPNEENPIS